MKIECIQITIDEANFLIPIDKISEVVGFVEIFPVPLVKKQVIGVSSIHGKIVVVIDLNKVLNLSDKNFMTGKQFILFKMGNENFAFPFEKLLDKVFIDEDQIDRSVENLSKQIGINAEGYIKVNNKVLVILSLEKVVNNLNEASE